VIAFEFEAANEHAIGHARTLHGKGVYDRRMRRAIVLGLCAACGGGKAAPPVAPAVPEAPAFTMTRHGIGPITDKTRATLASVRHAVAPIGLEVTPVFEEGHALEFDAYDGKDKMFYVVPNDDATILFVHATNRRVAIEDHPEWHIGAEFHDALSLGHCDCWGDAPICYRSGEHVAAGFAVSCEGLDSAKGRRALDGAVLTRVIWSPTVFETREVPSFLPRSD
jgi:hypothetical protein